jgi:hypothetical protein
MDWTPGSSPVPVRALSITASGDVATNANYNRNGAAPLVSRNISGTEWQVAAWWAGASEVLELAIRQNGGAWSFYIYDGVTNSPSITRTVDNHNTVALAIDADGYLHICYNMHANALLYRRTTTALASFSGTLTGTLSMVGTNEDLVTYPRFCVDPVGKLYFTFRNGASGNGDQYFYKYTESGQTWAAAAGSGSGGLIIQGTASSPTQNAYLDGPPQFTSNFDGAGTGFAWFMWTWRQQGGGVFEQHDVSVMRWNGSTFTKTTGAQTIPATLANCEIVDSSGTTTNLSGHDCFCVDSSGHPHAFHGRKDAGSGNSRLYHYTWNGSSWSIAAISPDSASYEWKYPDHLDCVIDGSDQISVVFANDGGTAVGTGVNAYISAGSSWGSAWTLTNLITADVGYADGTGTDIGMNHDVYQWAHNGKFQSFVPLEGTAATVSSFGSWTNYIQATGDAPTANLWAPLLTVVIDNTNTAWWAAVASDGKDIRVSTVAGQECCFDAVEFNYAGNYAVLKVKYPGDLLTTGGPALRVYAGNSGASAYSTTASFGQFNAYPYQLRAYYFTGGGNDRTRSVNNLTMTGSPSTTASTGPWSNTTYGYNGTTQYGIASASIITAVPLTIMGHFNSTNAAAFQTILSLADPTVTDNYFGLFAAGSVGGKPARMTTRNGTAANADTGTFAANTWYHAAGLTSAVASRTAYFEGVAGSAETTSITPSGITKLGVAVAARSGNDTLFAGRLSDVQLYNVVLTSAQIAYDYTQGSQTTFWNGWTPNQITITHVPVGASRAVMAGSTY